MTGLSLHKRQRGVQAAAVLGNLALKVAAAALSLLVSIAIARQLGAAEAGIFFFAQTIMLLLVAASRFGLDSSMVREAARLDPLRDHDPLQAVFTTGMTVMTVAALALAAAVACGIFGLRAAGLAGDGGYAAIALILVAGLPFLAFCAASGFFLQALGHAKAATLLVFAAQPAAHLALLVVLRPDDARLAAWLFVASAVIAAVGALLLLRRVLPALATKPRLRSLSSATLQGAGSLWGVSLTNQAIGLLPMVLLSVHATPADVAHFAIALRVAGLTGNVVVAVNAVFTPRIARALDLGRSPALRATLAAQAYTFVVGAPALLVLLVFPAQVLVLFGDDFGAARLALVIVTLGQVFNIATSASSMVLAMGGRERAMLHTGLIGLFACLVAGMVLVPTMSLIGASLVSVGALILVNGLYVRHAAHRLSAHPPASRG